MKKKKIDAAAGRELRKLFNRNGYVRALDARRRKKEKDGYKKGDEVRLVADTKAELAEIRKLLKRAGFKPGKPFAKSNQYRQPIYGVEAVARFLKMATKK